MARPFLTTSPPAVRVFHAALAVAGFVTIGSSFRNTLELSHPHVVNFFSYFTIESNLFAAAIWLWVALRPSPTPLQDRLRGAATLFMVITGIVYAVLLSGTPSPTPWINTLEHRVLPVLILVDWVVIPAAQSMPRAAALTWLAVPLTFFIYSLARGPIVHWYPYPFMNPTIHGYPKVIITALVLAALIAALALAVRTLGSRRRSAAADA